MKYRKKPYVVDAFQWTGGVDQKEDPEWLIEKIEDESVFFNGNGYRLRNDPAIERFELDPVGTDANLFRGGLAGIPRTALHLPLRPGCHHRRRSNLNPQ